MEKNFEGKQFIIPSIPGRKQPKIDCMLFPATSKEEIIYEPLSTDESKYLDKPTVIMCNPNALIY